jgi:hypothetical protein
LLSDHPNIKHIQESIENVKTKLWILFVENKSWGEYSYHNTRYFDVALILSSGTILIEKCEYI